MKTIRWKVLKLALAIPFVATVFSVHGEGFTDFQNLSTSRSDMLAFGGYGTRAIERDDSFEVERFNLRFKKLAQPWVLVARESYAKDQAVLVFEWRQDGHKSVLSIYAGDNFPFGATTHNFIQPMQRKRRESGRHP